MPWVEQLPNTNTTQTPSEEPTISAEPEPPAEPQPTADPIPSPQPNPMDLLEGSLLRVKVQPPAPKAKTGESLTESPDISWLQRLLRRR